MSKVSGMSTQTALSVKRSGFPYRRKHIPGLSDSGCFDEDEWGSLHPYFFNSSVLVLFVCKMRIVVYRNNTYERMLVIFLRLHIYSRIQVEIWHFFAEICKIFMHYYTDVNNIWIKKTNVSLDNTCVYSKKYKLALKEVFIMGFCLWVTDLL